MDLLRRGPKRLETGEVGVVGIESRRPPVLEAIFMAGAGSSNSVRSLEREGGTMLPYRIPLSGDLVKLDRSPAPRNSMLLLLFLLFLVGARASSGPPPGK